MPEYYFYNSFCFRYGEPLIVEPQTKESTINSTQPSHDRPLIMIKTEDSEYDCNCPMADPGVGL